MKKILLVITSLLVLVSCGKKENVLKIGVSPIPHKEIVELVKDDLKKDGINLEIIVFNDYVQPNISLKDKSIDANFFQHVPYMDSFNKEYSMNMVSVGGVHIEPIKVYSDKVKSLSELNDNSTALIPNDPSNRGRALLLLHNAGIITLKDTNKLDSSVEDIISNPKNIKFTTLNTEQIPPRLSEVDFAIINTNVAIAAKVNPEYAIYTENEKSPYVNVVSVLEENKDNENIKVLMKHLQSEKVKKFIEENYNGEVVAAF